MPIDVNENYLYYKEQKSQQRLREQAYDNDFDDDDNTDNLTELFREYID